VRHLRQVNLALWAKWHWRFLEGDGGIWRDIILARCDVCHPSPRLSRRPSGVCGMSSWWSNIYLLGGDREATGDWFLNGVTRVIGNGRSTLFWHDLWCGPTLLRDSFCRLFQLSVHPDGRVENLGVWKGNVWVWDLRWRSFLIVWETGLLNDLLVVVTRHPGVDRKDAWSWTLSTDGSYTVKSAYSFLIKGLPAMGALQGVTLQVAAKVWKLWPPSKVIVFWLQLLLVRTPSRLMMSKTASAQFYRSSKKSIVPTGSYEFN